MDVSSSLTAALMESSRKDWQRRMDTGPGYGSPSPVVFSLDVGGKEMGSLVLARKKDSRIIIGDKLVVITVIETSSDRCRLAFEASPDVKIHREEVYLKIKAQEAEQVGDPLADCYSVEYGGNSVDVNGAGLVNHLLEHWSEADHFVWVFPKRHCSQFFYFHPAGFSHDKTVRFECPSNREAFAVAQSLAKFFNAQLVTELAEIGGGK